MSYNCHYGNRNCSFTNTGTACPSEKLLKAKLLSRTYVSLVRMTLKRCYEVEKARNGRLDKQWAWPYISDFMHKRSYVWYMEMLTQQ